MSAQVRSRQKLKLVFSASLRTQQFKDQEQDWLTWNQNNVLKLNDVSTHAMLFQSANTINIYKLEC